ncbi:hypothetical protein OG921_24155 [Aldersonia sp. NBC_00410]|uniref:hypothetical protein n=1 Tax=Aldersonia sp. NBC_00410 TaxID=2975954 RepID=UPI002258CCD8|nr:hypothetical protein [Aldersonia sp. NBC_00410]MCX5046269.1 hypothetical protein [Aldersonia sp. NBC_00410]
MVFQSWPISFEPAVRREVSPPVAVIVDLSIGIARGQVSFANEVPLRVRAEGLQLDIKTPGRLCAWARTSRGDWLGRCQVRVPAGHGGYLELDQWFPAAAITPTAEM